MHPAGARVRSDPVGIARLRYLTRRRFLLRSLDPAFRLFFGATFSVFAAQMLRRWPS